MKTTLKTVGFTLGIVAMSSVSFGQKAKETSAAVEYKNNFQKHMMTGDMENAKKSLLTAKGFIDEASVHEDTKNSQKTLWLKGEIYNSLAMLKAQDSTFTDVSPEEAIETALAAYEQGYPLGKKLARDFETSANKNADLMFMAGGMVYEQEKFAEAAEAYELASRYRKTVGVLDSTAIFNASLCYEKAGNYAKAAEGYEVLAKENYRGTTASILASAAYRKAGNIEKAKAIINEARKADPSNKDLLLELVNANIDAGDAAGAEKALNDAIATDPNNKQLHYTIGTIYIDLGENEKAEQALNKALEIDPDYVDAQYQLGAHLVTWAGDLNTKAKQLPFGDPNYNKMLSESEDIYKRAIIPLEKYIGTAPNDKAVLTILFQLYRNLGNSEKALEYKKRADAAE